MNKMETEEQAEHRRELQRGANKRFYYKDIDRTHRLQREYDRKRREENPNRNRECSEYMKRVNPEYRSIKAREYAKRNPEKTRAQHILQYHVKRGNVKRPNLCSCCGLDGGLLHGHHPDYSKPLDVIWVCRKCHGKLSRKD